MNIQNKLWNAWFLDWHKRLASKYLQRKTRTATPIECRFLDAVKPDDLELVFMGAWLRKLALAQTL